MSELILGLMLGKHRTVLMGTVLFTQKLKWYAAGQTANALPIRMHTVLPTLLSLNSLSSDSSVHFFTVKLPLAVCLPDICAQAGDAPGCGQSFTGDGVLMNCIPPCCCHELSPVFYCLWCGS